MLDPVPALPPVTLDSTTVQAKVAPSGIELKAIPVLVPLQIVCDAGVATADGAGFTVITTFIGEPTQVPILGVTVYVTLPTLVLELVKTCAMLDPLPALAPLALFSETVQAKVAPTGVELNAIPVVKPLQMDCDVGVAVTVGIGFTVIVIVVLAAHCPASDVNV